MTDKQKTHDYLKHGFTPEHEHLMDINYNTDKLIILNYPGGAGGKFISLCLALDPMVIHQHLGLAKSKIKGGKSNESSFKVSKAVLTKNQKFHFELGCGELAGINSLLQREEQAKLANNLWRELTHQIKFYFLMVDHQGGNWDHYPNARHIVFKNYEWILEARGMKLRKIKEISLKKENIVYFDSSAVKDRTAFKDEIRKLFESFGLQEPNWDHIEELRSIWMNTVTVGFNNNKGVTNG